MGWWGIVDSPMVDAVQKTAPKDIGAAGTAFTKRKGQGQREGQGACAKNRWVAVADGFTMFYMFEQFFWGRCWFWMMNDDEWLFAFRNDTGETCFGCHRKHTNYWLSMVSGAIEKTLQQATNWGIRVSATFSKTYISLYIYYTYVQYVQHLKMPIWVIRCNTVIRDNDDNIWILGVVWYTLILWHDGDRQIDRSIDMLQYAAYIIRCIYTLYM